MSRSGMWKVGVTLVLAVALMVTAGGLVIGSNLGFKINKNVFGNNLQNFLPKNNTYLSLPYNHPYTTTENLCTALGITNGKIIKFNPQIGSVTSNSIGTSSSTCNGPRASGGCSTTCSETGFTHVCGTAQTLQEPDLPCVSSAGLLIQDVGGPAAGHGAVLVGSSNETKPWPILRGVATFSAPTGENYVSVPYHSTWVTAADVCASLTAFSPGLTGSVIRINAADGSAATNVCPNSNPFTLVLGESLLVRKTSLTGGNCDANGAAQANGPNVCNFMPPHF